MKAKLFFPALCALMLCLFACDPQNTPTDPNIPDVDNDSNVLTLSTYEILSTADGGEYYIKVTSTTSWTAQSNKDWVVVDIVKVTGDENVKLTVKAGKTADTAVVSFKNETESQKLFVYRAAPTYVGYSIAENKRVRIAPGNLQFQPATNTWRFAPHQYDAIGGDNRYISNSYTGWIDLFGWGTGGNPTKTSSDPDEYRGFIDWGTNAIQNGNTTDAPNTWRTLTGIEWKYLFVTRANAQKLYGSATVNKQRGLVVFPDDAEVPAEFKSGTGFYTQNKYSEAEWAQLEAIGAVFLPAGGSRVGTTIIDDNACGYYWACEQPGSHIAYSFCFSASYLDPYSDYDLHYGLSVRLAQDL